MNKNKQKNNIIILNKKARYDYNIEQTFEAGISLLGWEVKSLRNKKVNIKESYIILKRNELFLFNANITPENTASTHVNADNKRTRKLLLHKKEIIKIKEQIKQKGGTAIALKLYWLRAKIKLEIGVAFGKKLIDKRETIKLREWQREQARKFKTTNR